MSHEGGASPTLSCSHVPPALDPSLTLPTVRPKSHVPRPTSHLLPSFTSVLLSLSSLERAALLSPRRPVSDWWPQPSPCRHFLSPHCALTVHCTLYGVLTLHCTVYSLYTVRCTHSTLYGVLTLHCTVYSLYTVRCTHSTLYGVLTLHCTVYSLYTVRCTHSTLYGVLTLHGTVYSVLCTHCTLYTVLTVHCTLHTALIGTLSG